MIRTQAQGNNANPDRVDTIRKECIDCCHTQGLRKIQPEVIGIVLESAEPALIEKWCREGRLPVLQR
jgi:hypothetical protein